MLCIWALWFRQNRLRTEGKPVPIGDVLPMANQILTDFLRANPVNSGSTPTVQRSQVQFSKPIPPLVKINFDGAVFQDLSKAGVGVVVHDSHGMVLASMSEQIPLTNSVAEVEAIAAVKAVNFA